MVRAYKAALVVDGISMIAVSGNPLQGIGVLREVCLVMRGGVGVWPVNRVKA